ncbi:hypothetical protein PHAVU_006G169900 [Phaseolus vulgaris]|uniref:Uncharacterized protein n=1 Tax=Phaseolus vulgaris TaxID=3885 RepID=V7BPR9_PHAVU|nr:hypothetical protein PHAVU_006G169900g [Phaseolus vulgaris]ESW19967.1 hypothetical protein PHAVU_006G169900g [Phaseolus vulgaris]
MMAKRNICESALKVALVCVIALGSALAAENSVSEGLRPPNNRGVFFGSFSSGPHRGPPHYELSPPPPPHHGFSSSVIKTLSSGPYHGPPRYETSPPPPRRLMGSSYGSLSSGPYHGPPRYETSPPPPRRLSSSDGSFY